MVSHAIYNWQYHAYRSPCCHFSCLYIVLLSILVCLCPIVIQSHVILLSVNLDGSNTTSNDNFDEDDLEDKHLLPTSSVGEDTIVKEVHR